MATLATHFQRNQAVPRRETSSALPRHQQATRVKTDPYRLRALPNEDVYLFSKRIDNSRIVREADPRARGECWSAIGAASVVAAVLLTGVLAPSLGGIVAGYQLQSLKQEHQRLVDERSHLEVEEAKLLSPARLEQLARQQKLLQPSPGQLIHLDPRADGSLAMNVKK